MNGISAENYYKSVLSASGKGYLTMPGSSAIKADESGEFSDLFSALTKNKVQYGLSSTSLEGGLSAEGAFSLLGASGLGGYVLLPLLSSFSGGGDIKPEVGLLLMSMLMSSGSGAELSMISSILSIALSEKSGGAAVNTYGNNLSGINSQIAPSDAWVPANPVITSKPGSRSAECLKRVIGQFNVESSKRYEAYRYAGDTYCNIFVWDVTSALGAEIPHYIDPQTGVARKYPDVKSAVELGANGICDWLEKYGSQNGWTQVDAESAQFLANTGRPVVAVWKNPEGGSGHVQIVCPSENGEYDEERGVTVAQAGNRNFNYAYITSVYSGSALQQVRYYAHE